MKMLYSMIKYKTENLTIKKKTFENCVRCAAKIRFISTANESLIYNGVPLFAARKFVLKP